MKNLKKKTREKQKQILNMLSSKVNIIIMIIIKHSCFGGKLY